MAKQKTSAKAAAAPAKTDMKKINRMRRNALERKCLPKKYKNLFKGSNRETFRSILEAWQESRKKTSLNTTP